MPRIGETKCCNPACACADASVHRTAGGKLSAKCHKCGTERWAPIGTKAHRDLLAQTVMDDGAEPADTAPAPEPAPVQKAQPARARAANPFNMGL